MVYFYFILKVFRRGRGQLFHLSGELFSMLLVFFLKASLFHVDLETTSRGDECPGVCLSTAWLIYGILELSATCINPAFRCCGRGFILEIQWSSLLFLSVCHRLPMRPFHEDHSASYLSFLLYPPKNPTSNPSASILTFFFFFF